MNTNLASNAEVGDVETVLDDCLNQLNRGESLESCLAQHPMHAAWLEPLLRLAVQFQALRQRRCARASGSSCARRHA